MRNIKLLAIVFISACGGDDGPPIAVDLPASDQALCVALGTDQTVGTLAVVGLPSLTVLEDMVPNAISADPVIRVFGKKLYVVNRTAANVTILDTTTRPWTVEAQFSTGDNSDPQDVALAGDRLYVTLYLEPKVQVWDLSAGVPTAPAATIDLAGYDPDGVPNANSVVVHGGRAYVTLDLLDTAYQPRGKGKVVVIDTTSNTVVTALDLNYSNPYDFMVPRGDRLLVSTFADFSATQGCLEQIVPGAEPRVEPCLVENTAVMGIVNSIAVGPSETYRYRRSTPTSSRRRRSAASPATAPSCRSP
jgi:hypothetical protein